MSAVRCGRCLLSEFDMKAYSETIKDYIETIPMEKRASHEEYKARLDVCRECKELLDGMCSECGCFAEIRAAKAYMSCPVNKW